MPQTNLSQACKSCFERSGRTWTNDAESDLRNGICPKADVEDDRCGVSGERISHDGVVDSTRARRVL